MATIPARLSKGKQTTTQIITLLTNPSAFLSDTFSDLVYPCFLKVVEAGSLYYFSNTGLPRWNKERRINWSIWEYDPMEGQRLSSLQSRNV